MMPATEAYCPTCGSCLDEEAECPSCQVERPGREAAAVPGHFRSCRRCGAAVAARATVCATCGADHPSSAAGLAPVAQFVLGLFALAVALGIISFLVGPLVR